MSTLLLRLAAPLQSWGTESKFDTRQTCREPSKSGVIGLLACALGIRREDTAALDELKNLSFGIRVEQEGQLLMDYQTVKSYKEKRDFLADGEPEDAYQTYRYYLADAVFLAAVSSEDETLIQRLSAALRRPAFPLYLGRRSCPPTLPMILGVRNLSLEQALLTEPWHASETYKVRWQQQHPGQTIHLRLVLDAKCNGAAQLRDVPVSFDTAWRRYTFRSVKESQAMLQLQSTLHDALAEVKSCT